jgi:lactate permease
VVVLIATRAVGGRLTGAIWGWTALAAAAFLLPMWAIATFIGPELPTLGGSLIGGAIFVAVLLLVRRRNGGAVQPRPDAAGAGADNEPPTTAERPPRTLPMSVPTDAGALLRAGAPYLILIAWWWSRGWCPPWRTP